ncbi:sugar O-acetyltransferase, partial [Candidatus Bipolaricaulota bacterium]|nr:sugar O-acetyltransferase [Candidatus Bipolaricaulota bacterium]
MPTEKEKMLAGDFYIASDETLSAERLRARELLHQLNILAPGGTPGAYREIVRGLLPNAMPPTWIQPPFYCDYGIHIHAGKDVFFNFNCVILDCARVDIGAYTQFGPNVQIYAASHPLSADARRRQLECAKPVSIGMDCWIGGNVVICPGVTIGDRCVIGAGSVVTKDIPDDTLAVGNPAKPIRKLDREEPR